MTSVKNSYINVSSTDSDYFLESKTTSKPKQNSIVYSVIVTNPINNLTIIAVQIYIFE